MSEDNNGRDYEVGYCKPPVATRFPPGKSGNPNGSRGRKRKAAPASLQEIMKEALLKKQVVIHNGRRRRMSRFEIIAENLSRDAMQGDPDAKREVFRQAGLIDKVDREWAQANAGPQVLDVTLSLGDEEISRRIEQKLCEDRLREARETRSRE